VLEETASPEPVAIGLKCKKWLEDVEALLTLIFVAVIANVLDPDVIAYPD
jgi:hypothetical protein